MHAGRLFIAATRTSYVFISAGQFADGEGTLLCGVGLWGTHRTIRLAWWPGAARSTSPLYPHALLRCRPQPALENPPSRPALPSLPASGGAYTARGLDPSGSSATSIGSDA
jgi:hypothetical protein